MMPLIFIATAVLTGSSAVYLYGCHQRLSARIQHHCHLGKMTTSPKPLEIESIPESAFTDESWALYDRSTRSVPGSELPSSIPMEELFTKLVRRNMIAFSHFPQALMIRMMCKSVEEKQSFKASQLSSMDFQPGDLVCGAYRVVGRSRNKVEFEIQMKNMDFMSGRLALGFEEEKGQVVFSSETMMWRSVHEARMMPLEKPVIRWIHETAAWWLLDSGVKYLMDLE